MSLASLRVLLVVLLLSGCWAVGRAFTVELRDAEPGQTRGPGAPQGRAQPSAVPTPDLLGGASARYPWTVGFLPSYRGEGAVLGRDLVKTRPKAKVTLVGQNGMRQTGPTKLQTACGSKASRKRHSRKRAGR